MTDDINNTIQLIKKEIDIFRKAKLLDELIYKKGNKIINIAKLLDMKPSYVCHILRLNKVPEIIIDGYYAKLISSSHLFVLSRLKENQAMIALYEKILTDNLTVLQVEELVRDKLYGIVTKGKHLEKTEKDEFLKHFSSLVKDVEIRIVQTRIKAKMNIEIKGSLQKTSNTLRSIMTILKDRADKIETVE